SRQLSHFTNSSFAMSNTNLQETFNNFDYILNNYNEDLENIIFAGSFTSESVAESIESNNNNDLLNYDIEMPFLLIMTILKEQENL
ncbi:11823_t:CDS:1, partial [Funneliformis geosporum]